MGALQFSHEVRDAVDSWKGKVISYFVKLENFQGFLFSGGQLNESIAKKTEKSRKNKKSSQIS
jgi:hypothetical protein